MDLLFCTNCNIEGWYGKCFGCNRILCEDCFDKSVEIYGHSKYQAEPFYCPTCYKSEVNDDSTLLKYLFETLSYNKSEIEASMILDFLLKKINKTREEVESEYKKNKIKQNKSY